MAVAPAPRPRLVEEAAVLPPPRLSVSSYWHEGAEGHRRGLRDQETSRAPMLVYFRVDWCGYCRKVDQEVLPTNSVRQFLGDVVKVRINPETSPADRALADTYGVKGYPRAFLIPGPGAKPEDVEIQSEKFVEECKAVATRQSQNLVSEGATKVRGGDLAGGRADLERALALDPKNADAFEWRGLAALQAKEPGKAAGDLKRAIELRPDDPYPYAALASLYQEAGQPDDVIEILSQLITHQPSWEKGRAFRLRARSYHDKGDEAHARADLREACRQGDTGACGGPL